MNYKTNFTQKKFQSLQNNKIYRNENNYGALNKIKNYKITKFLAF